MADPTVLEVYRREVTPELYRDVRELYKKHSLAEDARDLEGLISTLTPDCVYELVQTGHRWEGHDGARRFYTELLTAFPGGLTTQEVAQLLTRGNDAHDRVEAEAAMLRLVADGAATRTPLGDDALWKPAAEA